MPLSDIVSVIISLQSGGITQAGFGLAMILSNTATFPERIRFYNDIDGVAADFATTTGEYKAAAALFGQNPCPERVAIGRAANKPTQKFEIKITTVANSTKYSFSFLGVQYDYTSDSTATNDEIATGLEAAVNAAATAAGFTSSLQGASGSKFVQILAAAAGNWASASVLDLTYLSIAQTHADPGVAADLAAIKLIDNTWYAIITLANSKAYVLAVAGFAESNEKLYLCTLQDSAVATDAFSGATDVAKTANASAYFRTAGIYHPDGGSFADSAWLGRCLPLDPGSETWMFKTLAGVAVTTLTGTQQTNIQDKKCNIYYNVAGRNITAEGVVFSGEFIDVVRFRDWLKARMQERIALALFNANKIPYTDEGIAVIEAEVRAQLREGVNVGGLVDNFTVSVPKAASVSPADKAARLLRNVKFTAQLAGAIHKVIISGTITA
jgi:hypothetical protein